MTKKTIQILWLVLFALTVPVTVALAQQAPPAKTGEAQDVQVAAAMKGKVFELKHRSATELRGILQGLGSGLKNASITANESLNILTVRDIPENLAVIEAAIHQLDAPPIPGSKRAATLDVEMVIHVLIAAAESGLDGPIPGDLNDVVKQLRSTLTFKSYALLTSNIQRARIPSSDIMGMGTVVLKPPMANSLPGLLEGSYKYHFSQLLQESQAGDPVTVTLKDFIFALSSGVNRDGKFNFGQVEIRTNLTLKEGERVVVGTASIQDKAVVLVLSLRRMQ